MLLLTQFHLARVNNNRMAYASSTSSDSLTSNWSRFTTTNNPPLTQPWERATTSCHNTTLTSTNPSYNSSNEYSAQKVQCSCYELADRIFRTQSLSSSSLPDQSYHSDSSHCSCLNGSNYLKTTNLFHTKHENYRFPDLAKSSMTNLRDDKHDIWQDLMLTRSSFASKYRMPEFGGMQFQSQYNPYWTFSSMPEMPVTLVDDEFMVDAGIRIPSQLASSQSSSKIPNLQDIIYRNKKLNTTSDRLRRTGASFEKSKPFDFSLTKRFSSLDYDDGDKQPPSTSANYSPSNREPQYSAQSVLDDRPKSSGISSQNRTRFGFEMAPQRKPLEDKAKRNSILLDKDRGKPLPPKNMIDRNKRHATNYYAIKLPDSKDTKMKFKRHSIMQVAEYNPADHRNLAGRTLRRFSTLDVNHNQGLSKIPVRNIHISGSRTAPVTRTSSPIRVDSELFEKLGYSNSGDGGGGGSYAHERRLRRYRSSDQEVDKLCQKF